MSVCSDDIRVGVGEVALDGSVEAGQCEALLIDAEAVGRASRALKGLQATRRVTDIFSALADSTRVKIMQALSVEDLCVCDLSAVVGVSQSAVSHQLRLLRDRDLVAFTRDGKRAVYRLADEHVRVLLAQGIAHAEEER